MQKITLAQDILKLVNDLRSQNKSVGFVATMGGFHEGHLSLVRRARKENDVVIASIYVNPQQFGPNEDFDSYPRDLEKDSNMLIDAGTDYLFYPNGEEIYPGGILNDIPDLPYFCTPCDGTSRPVFFMGIARAVSRLFQIVPATVSYFGQKDYQQSLLAQWLCDVFDFDMKIVVCPIAREEDGLAISSRNWYLSEEERSKACILNVSLKKMKEAVLNGERNTGTLKKMLQDSIETVSPLFAFDYAEVRERGTMKENENITSGNSVALVAAFAGKARLIDNVLL